MSTPPFPISSLSTDGALHLAYPPKAVETMMQQELLFRPRMSRSLPPGARQTDGYKLRFGARLQSSQNVGQIADGGNFPTTKLARDLQYEFSPTIFTGAYDLSGLTRYIASSNVSAFNGGESRRRPEEVMTDLGKMIEQTYVGGNGNGILGYVESTGSSSFVVKAPYGVRLIPPKTLISVRIAAGSTIRDSLDAREVTDVDIEDRIVYYSGTSQTVVADDPIYRVTEASLAGATLAAINANGLRGQVDDGADNQYIHTLDRLAVGNSALQSYVDRSPGGLRDLDEDTLIGANLNVRLRASKRPSTIITAEGQVRKYIQFVAPQRRWNISGGETQGKTTGFQMDQLRHDAPGVSMDWMMSPDCLGGELYGVSWDCFFFYSALDAQWMSGTDATLHLLPGSAGATHRFAWGAYLVSIENWGTDYPRAHFKITDLKDILNGTA